jgi:hypothetical protein
MINKNIKKPFIYGVTVFLYLVFIFGRSFTGIYLFGFRIGEITIGVLILISTILFFTTEERLNLSPRFFQIKSVFNLLFLAFLTTSILTKSNIFDLYTFKVSSYIWLIPSVFIGLYIGDDFLSNKKIALFISTSLPTVYILSTVKFPERFIDFFVNYSDKFDFVKASDLLLVYVFVNLLLRINFQNSFVSLSYFIISSAVMFPMFLFKSKGSFVACVIFFVLELYQHLSLIRVNVLKTIGIVIISLIFFVVSSFEISGDSILNGLFDENSQVSSEFVDTTLSNSKTTVNTEPVLEKESKKEDNPLETQIISETLIDNFDNKIAGNGTTDETRIFEIRDGRIFSSDNTLNWRFQIWQDVIYDLIDKNIIFTGYGYTAIIPAMESITRSGVDNSNENVHNFFINILARGGVLQLAIIVYIFIILLKLDQKKNLLNFILPLLVVSMFDSAMESVRFPISTYLIAGSLLSFNNKNKSDIIE